MDATCLRAAVRVSCVLLSSCFSSRLILVAAADSPMKTAKIGSAALEMMYVGAGMLIVRMTGSATLRPTFESKFLEALREQLSAACSFERAAIRILQTASS